MLYELAHFIKDKAGFLWAAAEWVNAQAFACCYRRGLKQVPGILSGCSSESVEIREVEVGDCAALAQFFAAQPEDAFAFFKPHAFDEKSLQKLARRESFLMFVAVAGDEIVGYCFMRSFVNGQAYRGYMVDVEHRGQGIARMMGKAMNDAGTALGLKMFKSVSPDNVASMAATKSCCEVEVVKTLDNGDLLLACFPKK